MSKILIVSDEQFDYLHRLIDSEEAAKAQPMDMTDEGYVGYRHLDGDVNYAHDLQDALAKVPRLGDVVPEAEELIDAAAELRHVAGLLPDQSVGDRATAMLEQIAILLLPLGGKRDELLEGRTDLGQPETRLTGTIYDPVREEEVNH